MFHKHKLSRDGAQAQALVLAKKVYASGVETGMTSACRYELRVKFADGSTVDTSCRAFSETLAAAAIGDIVPVRYDPSDRSKIELDRDAIVEQQKAQARDRDAGAIARGETALGLASAGTPATSVVPPRAPDTGEFRVGDADRELIAEVLSQHMTDGRLTTDELDGRLGELYMSQTRAQASAVLADLPPLVASVGQPGAAVPALPDWVSAPEPPVPMTSSRPSGGGSAHIPTDGEMTTAYGRWQAKADKVKADKAAHKHAEESANPTEIALALRRLTISRAEEKSARAKYDQLRKRRPDWTAGER